MIRASTMVMAVMMFVIAFSVFGCGALTDVVCHQTSDEFGCLMRHPT